MGLTERQARAAGRAVRTVSYDIGSAAAGALAGTGVHGTAALVIDTTRRVVLGATLSVRAWVRCCIPRRSPSSGR